MVSVPNFDSFFRAVLQALKDLGGSGTNREIYDKVAENENISDEVLDVLHNDGPLAELEYRLRWTQTYLKKYETIDNPIKGVWSILAKGRTVSDEELKNIKTYVRKINKDKKKKLKLKKIPSDEELNLTEEVEKDLAWNTDLLNQLKSMDPSAFERLSERLLRASGFVKVKVTGKPADGGIDGVGVLRMNLVSFQVMFQCKRYKKTVPSSAIRDFRGAMMGRADKGLVITTGTFTSEAKKEAVRDGTSTIDLIDGDELCELLKEFRIGVKVEQVEKITIENEFFKNL